MQSVVIDVPFTMRVVVSDLEREVTSTPVEIDTIVFQPPGAESLVPAMLRRFSDGDADALVAVSVVHEAIKRVHDGVVQTGMDRADVVTVAGPEVVSRATLVAALLDRPHESTIDPAAFLAERGKRVLAYPVRSRD
jgi:hypothetical protein